MSYNVCQVCGEGNGMVNTTIYQCRCARERAAQPTGEAGAEGAEAKCMTGQQLLDAYDAEFINGNSPVHIERNLRNEILRRLVVTAPVADDLPAMARKWLADNRGLKTHEGRVFTQQETDLAEFAAAIRLGFNCAAKKTGIGGYDPQDCGWPFCGCDPAADKVIAVLLECGWNHPPHPLTPERVSSPRNQHPDFKTVDIAIRDLGELAEMLREKRQATGFDQSIALRLDQISQTLRSVEPSLGSAEAHTDNIRHALGLFHSIALCGEIVSPADEEIFMKACDSLKALAALPGQPSPAPETQLELIDRADCVESHYCIGKKVDGFYSFWNPRGWAGSGYVFTERPFAEAIMKLLAHPSQPSERPQCPKCGNMAVQIIESRGKCLLTACGYCTDDFLQFFRTEPSEGLEQVARKIAQLLHPEATKGVIESMSESVTSILARHFSGGKGAELVTAVESLLEWVPKSGVGSSGYQRVERVKAALNSFGEGGSLNGSCRQEASRESDTGGEISDANNVALSDGKGADEITYVTRATGRKIPDLTKKEHVCEWQSVVKPVALSGGSEGPGCPTCEDWPLSFRVQMDHSISVVCTQCQVEFKHWQTLHNFELDVLSEFFRAPVEGKDK